MAECVLPAFLRVIPDVQKQYSYTRYLLHPLVDGEIVKVVGNQDAVRSKRYVDVIRKDKNGNWTLRYVLERRTLENLKRK